MCRLATSRTLSQPSQLYRSQNLHPSSCCYSSCRLTLLRGVSSRRPTNYLSKRSLSLPFFSLAVPLVWSERLSAFSCPCCRSQLRRLPSRGPWPCRASLRSCPVCCSSCPLSSAFPRLPLSRGLEPLRYAHYCQKKSQAGLFRRGDNHRQPSLRRIYTVWRERHIGHIAKFQAPAKVRSLAKGPQTLFTRVPLSRVLGTLASNVGLLEN